MARATYRRGTSYRRASLSGVKRKVSLPGRYRVSKRGRIYRSYRSI